MLKIVELNDQAGSKPAGLFVRTASHDAVEVLISRLRSSKAANWNVQPEVIASIRGTGRVDELHEMTFAMLADPELGNALVDILQPRREKLLSRDHADLRDFSWGADEAYRSTTAAAFALHVRDVGFPIDPTPLVEIAREHLPAAPAALTPDEAALLTWPVRQGRACSWKVVAHGAGRLDGKATETFTTSTGYEVSIRLTADGRPGMVSFAPPKAASVVIGNPHGRMAQVGRSARRVIDHAGSADSKFYAESMKLAWGM